MHLRPAVFVLCLHAVGLPGTLGAQTFTTVEEVKPILTAIQPNWIAVRNWQGQDLLYFTQIESWRCGLREIRYSVNNGPETTKAMEPCYTDAPSPNAFQDSDHLPYVAFGEGEVDTVSVTVVYSDGSTASGDYKRADIELR